MAAPDDVLDAIVDAITTALNSQVSSIWTQTRPNPAGLTPIRVYKGWPTPEELDTDIENTITNISVFWPGQGNVTTTFTTTTVVASEPTVSLTANLSSAQLQGGNATTAASATITFSGSVTSGTITMFILNGTPTSVNGSTLNPNAAAISYVPAANETLAQVATGVAAAINANSTANTQVTASASGAVVTITASSVGTAGNAITVNFQIGGTGNLIQSFRQQRETFQIHIWAPSDDDRKFFANLVDMTFAQAEFLEMATQDAGRILYKTMIQSDAESRHGIFRRVLVYTVDYPSTVLIPAVAVLDAAVTVGPM